MSSEGRPLGLSKRASASHCRRVPMRSDAWKNLFSGGLSGRAASHGILPAISRSCLTPRWPASARATWKRPKPSSRNSAPRALMRIWTPWPAIPASTRSTSRRRMPHMPIRPCRQSPMANQCWSRSRSRHPLPMPSASRVPPPDRNCFAMEGMWTRFLPAVRAAKKLIDDGAIGTITGIEADLSYYRDEDVDDRFFNAALGGGSALDLGVYPLSLTLHLLGKPQEISGRWYASKSGVDMRSEFDLQFAGATGPSLLRLRPRRRQSVCRSTAARRCCASKRRSSRRRSWCASLPVFLP